MASRAHGATRMAMPRTSTGTTFSGSRTGTGSTTTTEMAMIASCVATVFVLPLYWREFRL